MSAESAFNQHAHFWATKGSTKKQRAQLLEKVTTQKLTWAAGTWTLSVHDLQMLRAVQLRCFSKVIRFARVAGESD